MKNKFSVSVGIGAPSLMTIFLILSLISFSVLSYMTSRANLRFAENLQNRTTAYYEASNLGEQKLILIRESLESAFEQSNEENYFQHAKLSLAAYVPGITIDPENHVGFTLKINDNQDLNVGLQLINPWIYEGEFFFLNQWQVKQTAAWEPDNSLNLIQSASD